MILNQRMMFWIQKQGQTALSVVKVPMGSINGPLVIVTKFALRDPRGLTIDSIRNRVYGADAGFTRIRWAHFESGEDFSIALMNNRFIPQRLRI